MTIKLDPSPRDTPATTSASVDDNDTTTDLPPLLADEFVSRVDVDDHEQPHYEDQPREQENEEDNDDKDTLVDYMAAEMFDKVIPSAIDLQTEIYRSAAENIAEKGIANAAKDTFSGVFGSPDNGCAGEVLPANATGDAVANTVGDALFANTASNAASSGADVGCDVDCGCVCVIS